MMSDPSIREGYMQSAVANGIQAAGCNPNGSTAGFMGINMGMGAAGSFMGGASATNMAQMQQQAQQQAQQAAQQAPAGDTWTCSCGTVNTGNFCPTCGAKKPEPETWTCACGSVNTGNFCPVCGAKKPE